LKNARDDYDLAARKGDARAMIETNRTFHLVIAEASDNTHLVRTTRDLLIKAVRLEGLWHTRGNDVLRRDVKRSRQEHDSLVDAILRRDVRAAEDLAHVHVRSFREPFLNYLDSSNAQDITLYPIDTKDDRVVPQS
jgi:DNA-binding GntR family transcriptional regulator